MNPGYNRGSRRPLFSLVLLAACVLAAPAGLLAQPAEKPVKIPRLFVLLVADTASNLRNDVIKDRDNLKKVLEDGFATRPNRLLLRVLDGKEATRADVLKHYRGLKGKVQAGDTLLFYYSGHGATFPEQGHCLTMQRDLLDKSYLTRKELLQEMQQLSPRLVVLLTDCCSKLPDGVQADAVKALPKATWPVMDLLFFHHQGVTDINGCQKDAFSWSYTDKSGASRGGTFTLALLPLLCQKKEDFQKVFGSADGFVTWEQVREPLQTETNRLYQQLRSALLARDSGDPEGIRAQESARLQEKQTPQVLALARKALQEIADHKWLFGAEFTSALQGKMSVVYIVKVYPNTPAAEAGLRQGDVILTADKRPTPTPAELAQAIDHSEGPLLVAFNRNGQMQQARVKLKLVKPK